MRMGYQNQPRNPLHRSPAPLLRHSCDICNIAKVKCSKTRPRCARCEARDLECVYSVSLRSAKGKAASTKDVGSKGFNEERNDSSHETSSSAHMTFSNPIATQSMMPPLSTTSIDTSILGEWNSNFSGVDDRVNFTEPNEVGDPTMILSHVYPENGTGSDHQDQILPDSHYKHPLIAFDPNYAHRCNENSSSSAKICSCRQKILTKLSECWLIGRDIFSAFDKSLSENKIIIGLCTSTLNCSDQCHTDDIILKLLIIALINQVINIYDSAVPDNHSSNASGAETPINSLSMVSSTPSNRSSVNGEIESQFLPPTEGVRLSLGSYQLDQQDEQILKATLLRIELDKIGALIELFEKRCCSAREWNISSSSHRSYSESNPFHELITYQRRRLRIHQEALRT